LGENSDIKKNSGKKETSDNKSISHDKDGKAFKINENSDVGKKKNKKNCC
jgi:hypothetical protein